MLWHRPVSVEVRAASPDLPEHQTQSVDVSLQQAQAAVQVHAALQDLWGHVAQGAHLDNALAGCSAAVPGVQDGGAAEVTQGTGAIRSHKNIAAAQISVGYRWFMLSMSEEVRVEEGQPF